MIKAFYIILKRHIRRPRAADMSFQIFWRGRDRAKIFELLYDDLTANRIKN
jgi:hypothetical protein